MSVLKPVALCLAAFALLFVAALVIGETSSVCPKFVMSDVNSSECSGQWYLTHVVNVSIKLPEIKCFTEINAVDTHGVIKTSQFVIETEADIPLPYTTKKIPINKVHQRLAYYSTLEEENVDINVILKIEPKNYFLIGLCATVEDTLGYRIYVLAQKRQLEDNTVADIKKFLTDNNLSGDLNPINQTECPDVQQILMDLAAVQA